jgi:hypothetical protein
VSERAINPMAVLKIMTPAAFRSAVVVVGAALALTSACSSSVSTSAPSDSRVWNELNGVACAGTSLCFAVGDHFEFAQTAPFKNYRTLIQRWNGSSWSLISSPNTVGDSRLAKVSCVNASHCVAVGSVAANAQEWQALIEEWNGTAWSTVAPPVIGGSLKSLLSDVSCFGASLCFAVGEYTTGANGFSLVEEWTGSSWHVVPSSHTGVLKAVTCASSSLCFALGVDSFRRGSGLVDEVIIETWNGFSWTTDTFPQLGLGELDGIGCAGPSLCFAAGYGGANDGSNSQPLIERWNGLSWATIKSPPSSPIDSLYGKPMGNRLSRVHCLSASLCFAAGNRYSVHGADQLIQRWNGLSWEIDSLPKISSSPTPNHTLADVVCAARTICFTVGSNNDYGDVRTLVERWNGSTWSVAESPNFHA